MSEEAYTSYTSSVRRNGKKSKLTIGKSLWKETKTFDPIHAAERTILLKYMANICILLHLRKKQKKDVNISYSLFRVFI